jgi:hypothetical protein
MESNNSTKLLSGGLLILFGGLWLAANFIPGFNINWDLIWPLFLVIPGLVFWVKYLSATDRSAVVGMLIPANILLFLGLIFYFNIFASDVLLVDNIWVFTAFMYPGSVALAFWITWFASKRQIPFLIPAVILSGISLLVFCGTSAVSLIGGEATSDVSRLTWPLLIVCLGFFVLLSPIWSNSVFKSSNFGGKNTESWEKWMEDFGKSIENAFEEKPTRKSSAESDAEIEIANAVEAELVESEEIDPDKKD